MSRLSSSYIIRRSISRKVTHYAKKIGKTEIVRISFLKWSRRDSCFTSLRKRFAMSCFTSLRKRFAMSCFTSLRKRFAMSCFTSLRKRSAMSCFTSLRKRFAVTGHSSRVRSHSVINIGGAPCGYPHYINVELEGFEPSSKRGTNMLSTCVVSDWFSKVARPGRPNHPLSRKISHERPGADRTIPDIPAPPYRLVSEKGQSGDVSSPQLLQG